MLFYQISFKPRFSAQLMLLPPRDVLLVLSKVKLLEADPTPDAKNKKRLKGYKKTLYRIRAGDQRILYTFDERSGWIELIGVDARKDVYDKSGELSDPPPWATGNLPEVHHDALEPIDRPFDWQSGYTLPALDEAATPESNDLAPIRPAETNWALPRTLDDEVLSRLRVSREHWPILKSCQSLDDLCTAEVPEQVRNRVFDAITDGDYDRTFDAPLYVLETADDWQRLQDGDLVGFLLRLDPEQDKYVSWSVSGTGPAMLKGAPGTGKSIVAIYRVRALIASLRRSGIAQPRILFTTYTNALVSTSRQLLDRLLGEDASLVEVQTADKLVAEILRSVGESGRSLDDDRVRAYIENSRRRLQEGTETDRQLADRVAMLSIEYLREELDGLIVAREHASLEAYAADSRAGRRVRLTKAQKEAIWRLHEEYESLMNAQQERSFAMNRRRAAEIVREGRFPTRYDGVIVDEAQDLQPSALRMLIGVSRSPDRLLFTADANQSIYGSHFRWADVHGELRFRGRTGVLRRNYRSTREISEATRRYLAGAELDEPDGLEPLPDASMEYVRSGPRPKITYANNNEEERDSIVQFLRAATREQRVGYSACAVLVPLRNTGERLQKSLRAEGLVANFMTSASVDLNKPGVKILTFQSSKGLEFPVVALAGLRASGSFLAPAGLLPEEIDEKNRLDRRLLYVAMTRAMKDLLVILPSRHTSPLVAGFDPAYWETTTDRCPSDAGSMAVSAALLI